VTVVPQRRLLDVLDQLVRALIDGLDADACAVSRVIGDTLLLVREVSPPERPLQQGTGFLISDYPRTGTVLESRAPATVLVGGPDGDAAEERLLQELGYAALLMLPLELQGGLWGLIEVYRVQPRPFGPVEVRAAVGILEGVRGSAG
jgi:GAF domain-containing protein